MGRETYIVVLNSVLERGCEIPLLIKLTLLSSGHTKQSVCSAVSFAATQLLQVRRSSVLTSPFTVLAVCAIIRNWTSSRPQSPTQWTQQLSQCLKTMTSWYHRVDQCGYLEYVPYVPVLLK